MAVKATSVCLSRVPVSLCPLPYEGWKLVQLSAKSAWPFKRNFFQAIFGLLAFPTLQPCLLLPLESSALQSQDGHSADTPQGSAPRFPSIQPSWGLCPLCSPRPTSPKVVSILFHYFYCINSDKITASINWTLSRCFLCTISLTSPNNTIR